MTEVKSPLSFQSWLAERGEVFKEIKNHDSGNLSFGIKAPDSRRYFVKFAPAQNKTAVIYLKNACRLSKNVKHPLLADLKSAVNCRDGLALVYEWIAGDTINEVTLKNKHSDRQIRKKPRSPYQRFRSLPGARMTDILSQIFALHVNLEEKGYVSSDWYDGCLIYNFASHELRIIDLDHYSRGPFLNLMGRLYGSSRFMAPEEYTPGAVIDRRTTVYHIGATVFEFLGTGKDRPEKGFRGSEKQFKTALQAIKEDKRDRYSSVKEFTAVWLKSKNQS